MVSLCVAWNAITLHTVPRIADQSLCIAPEASLYHKAHHQRHETARGRLTQQYQRTPSIGFEGKTSM